MNGSGSDFGSSTISKRELRTLLIWSSATVVFLLLFGVAMAVRLRTPDTAAPGTEAEIAEATDAMDPSATEGAVRLAPTTPTQPILPSEGTPHPPRFGVRVGIFSVPENADGMLLRLQAEGYAPFVVFHRLPDRTLRYVYAGVSATEAEAAILASEIEDNVGIDTHVEPVEPVR